MKRVLSSDDVDPTDVIDDEKLKKKKKKIKNEEDEEDEEEEEESEIIEDENGGIANLSDDLLFEVLKHVDARSLATSTCVSKKWNKMAQDERLWEMICTRYWATIGCGNRQLRSVILALGGFRRLHSLYIWPLLKSLSSSASSSSSSPPASSSSSSSLTSPFPTSLISSKTMKTPNWGKDEIHLSLSLLSIRYYEMMNFNTKGGGGGRSSSSSSSASAAADELRKEKSKQ